MMLRMTPGEWTQKIFGAPNKNIDLVIRSEGGSKQVAAEISFAAENP
jgi:hypothetical protein